MTTAGKKRPTLKLKQRRSQACEKARNVAFLSRVVGGARKLQTWGSGGRFLESPGPRPHWGPDPIYEGSSGHVLGLVGPWGLRDIGPGNSELGRR
eukprot:4470074-Pyramimonas_sp.AAC.1